MYFSSTPNSTVSPGIQVERRPMTMPWSTTVPSSMPWATQMSTGGASNEPQIMRFSASSGNFNPPPPSVISSTSSQFGFVNPFSSPQFVSPYFNNNNSPSATTCNNNMILPSNFAMSSTTCTSSSTTVSSSSVCLPVYPGDPCTSGLSSASLSSACSTSPSFPSTSYNLPRSKRKLVESESEIRQKQLITDKMVAQMNDLSLSNVSSSSQHPFGDSEASRNCEEGIDEVDGGEYTKSSTPTKIVLSNELKEVVACPTIEQRLALEVSKKSTMALMLWSPPKILPFPEKSNEEDNNSDTKPSDIPLPNSNDDEMEL